MQKDGDNYICTGTKNFDLTYTAYLEVSDGLIFAGDDGGLAIFNNNGGTLRYPSLSSTQSMPSITTTTNDGVFLYENQ
jgi:hypothetical protein